MSDYCALCYGSPDRCTCAAQFAVAFKARIDAQQPPAPEFEGYVREEVHAAALARLAQVEAERDMLRGVGCNENGDGPCGACIKCARARESEAKRYILTDEERRKLTGDALFAEGQVAAVRAELDSARSVVEAARAFLFNIRVVEETAYRVALADMLALYDSNASGEWSPPPILALVDSFAETVEQAAASRSTKGGQQVPYHGDFGSCPPSTYGQLRRWARDFRRALTPKGDGDE